MVNRLETNGEQRKERMVDRLKENGESTGREWRIDWERMISGRE